MKSFCLTVLGIFFPLIYAPAMAQQEPRFLWSQLLPTDQRFQKVMQSDDGILDKETGLVWMPGPLPARMTWADAAMACFDRPLGGRKGWRLPTIEELTSLIDPAVTNQALPAGAPFH